MCSKPLKIPTKAEAMPPGENEMTLNNVTRRISAGMNGELAKENDNFSEIGWEAGIRTPIPWSRAMCPTVGRPPSASRDASKRRELSIIAVPTTAASERSGRRGRQQAAGRDEARVDPSPAQQSEHLEETRTCRPSRHRHAHGMDERSRLHTAGVGDRAKRGFR